MSNDQVFCSSCGERFSPGDVFCNECGKPRGKLVPRTAEDKKPGMRRKWLLWAIPTALVIAGAVAAALIFLLPGDDAIAEADGTATTLSEEGPISLGAAEVKWPAEASLIQTESWGEVPANQVLVLLREGSARADAERVAQELGGTVVGYIEYISLYQIETAGATEAELSAALEVAAAIASVEVAAPNVQSVSSDIQGIVETPLNDLSYQGKNRNPLDMIGLQDSWDMLAGAKALGIGGNKTRVGVVDTRLYESSGELNIVEEGQTGGPGQPRVFAEGVKDWRTVPGHLRGPWQRGEFLLGHGGATTQLVCADPTDGGMAGVASILREDLEVVWVQYGEGVLSEVEQDTPEQLIYSVLEEGVEKSYVLDDLVKISQAIQKGAKVINCSWGARALTDGNEPITKCFKRFLDKLAKDHPDVLVVAAAGNDNAALNGINDWWGFDAPNLVTVSAVDREGNKAEFANYAAEGGTVDIAAPGVDLFLGVNSDSGTELLSSGTSYAAPQVTAVAALIRSIAPHLTAKEVKDIIKEAAAKSVTVDGKTTHIPGSLGAGILRADKAVLLAVNTMRAKQEKEPVDRDTLIGMGRLKLTASGGPVEYEITATVDAVPPEGTILEIDVTGHGAIIGPRTQTLEAPGTVTWTVTKMSAESASEKTKVTVTRLDSDVTAFVELTSSLAGTYVGTMQISTVLPGYNQTITGSADLTATVDESGSTVFSLSGTSTFVLALGGGMSATETISISAKLTGMTTPTALEATGTMSVNTVVSGAGSANVTQSYQGTAKGSLTDASSMSGTIELQGVNTPYTITWTATRQ